MVGLLVCFGGLLVVGLFFLAADSLRLPYLKTSKVMINTGRKDRRAAKSLGTCPLSLAIKLAPHIHIDEYKWERQKNILKASGLSMEPEMYQAYVISKVELALLGIVPCLLVFPLLAVIAAVLAAMVYFKGQERADELLAKKRGELEGELPRFVSIIEQELKNSRDVLPIVENFKKNTGNEFANGLEILAANMCSSSYEATLTRFEVRINSSILPDVVRGVIGVLHGDDGAMHFRMLSHDFKQMELQRLKKEAQEIPPKIRVFSFLTLVCFIVTYLAIIVFGILKFMGSMFQKRGRRRREGMSSVENETGARGKEAKDGREQKPSGTVREFLERYPEEPVFVMTPGRHAYLAPEQIGNLLVGQVVSGSPYSWRECVQIKAEEFLQQKVDSVNHTDGTWYVLTRLSEPEVIPVRTGEEGMVCRIQRRYLPDKTERGTSMWRFQSRV